MTNAEFTRRIVSLTPELYGRIALMLRQGYSARGISLETPASLKQINAVVKLEAKYPWR
jgi:hypothetical protein